MLNEIQNIVEFDMVYFPIYAVSRHRMQTIDHLSSILEVSQDIYDIDWDLDMMQTQHLLTPSVTHIGSIEELLKTSGIVHPIVLTSCNHPATSV